MKIVTALAGLLLGLTAAQAGELSPLAAGSIRLGEVTGVSYYTVEGDSFKVVTTLAAGETGTPIRFVTTLLPGQSTTVSVPRELGQSPLAIEIKRINDQLFLGEPKKTVAAAD